MALTPTLWRTSRVLAGKTRLDLLQRILCGTDEDVSKLAHILNVSEPRASQELRRLQARGLVQAAREGRYVRYRPVPDPKVASAKPILAAAKAALGKRPLEENIRVAQAFGHDRRLRIVRELMKGARGATELAVAAGMPELALFRHLRVLREGDVVRQTKTGWELAPNMHPLAKAMMGLLAEA